MLLFKRRGEITIFLSLLLSSVLALIAVTFKSAGNQTVKFQDEVAMDAALRSCFGEYHKELFEKYHLLYIDAAYRVADSDVNNISSHLQTYMNENIDFDKQKGADLLKVKIGDVGINKYILSSDQSGLPVYLQIINYLQEYGDTTHTEKISNLRKELPYFDAEDLFNEWDAALEHVRSFGVFFVNPAEIVRSVAGKGEALIMSVRNGKTGGISYNDIPSKRFLKEGNYGVIEGIENELVCSEYYYQVCGSYIHPQINSVLSAELEYLLYGNSTDSENTKSVLKRLIRIFARENLSYICGSGGCLVQIHEYAEEIVPLPINPEDPLAWAEREALVAAVGESLRYAWAECDAILKVDRLFGGGKIPGNNPGGSWILPLRELTGFLGFLRGSGGSGYSYEEYIVSFFSGINRNILSMRFLDLIEMNMRKMGSPGFCVDGCVEYINAFATTNSVFGKEYSITRDFSYEDRYKKVQTI